MVITVEVRPLSTPKLTNKTKHFSIVTCVHTVTVYTDIFIAKIFYDQVLFYNFVMNSFHVCLP